MKPKNVKKYIRQIKRIYRGNRNDKMQFILELEDALLCFHEEHPDSSYDDLVAEFGKPSEMKDILSFHSAKKLQKRNIFLYWLINILFLIMVIIILCFTIRHVVDMYNYSQGYYIEYDDTSPKSDINPITNETDPPLDNHIDFN